MNLKRLLVVMPIVVALLVGSMPVGVVAAEDQPLFKITIIAPGNANMVRRQWGQLIANSWRQLGIDARVVYLGWAPVYDRVLTPSRENVGKTWENGGFDAQLIGWTPGLIPEPRQLYSGREGFLAPDGQNYVLWVNEKNDQLLDTFITSTDPAEQERVLKEWQQLFYDEMPASQIVYQSRPSFVNPKVTIDGSWWLHFNAQPIPEYIRGKTEVVYASTGEIQSLIPPLANSWYDTIIHSPIHGGLVQVNSDLSDYAAPSLLTSWAPSDNGFTWTFNVRHGVKWHDGEEFTADDIIFSLHSLMNANTGSQFVGYYQSVYGNNVAFTYSDGTTTSLGTGTKMGTIKALDKYTVQAKIPELTGGKPFGYFDPYLLGLGNNIIAKHIFENIEPAQWSGTPFNTGQGEIVIKGKTYTGPVGTGPYKWGGFDPVTQLVTLLKNTEYWDRAALEAEGNFGVQKYYIKFIADKTPAIAALKNGQVDILDPNYEMNVDAKTVDPAWATVVQQDGAGRQELGYNMQHPIWGTGVDTPLGKATPARAAEAARYVRQAFDYAIPRQLVIDNLMDGSGLPGCTAMLPTQAFYNSAVTARPYNLTLAKSLLTKAGYKVPGYTPVNPPPTPPPPTPPPTGGTTIQPVSVGGFLQGMSSVITGTYTISGNPVANRELWLMASGTDKDYQTAAVFLDKTMTDLSGYYTFTVTPTKAGSTYYFIFDRMGGAGSEWTAAGKLDVITLNDAFKPVTTALADVQNKAQATQTAATAIQADVTALKTSVAALQTSLTAVQQSNTQLSTKIDNLTSQLTAANASATNAMYVGAGGILVALGVGVWVMMKKKEDE